METRTGLFRWPLRLLLVLIIVLAPTPFVDQKAESQYEQLFQRALVTFALARTLNGVISVVQGTELALQPAGVGVTLTPGEILDPVNDLVERFSWVMMFATISLGIQNVLLDISAWWPVQALVSLLAAWWLARSWFPALGGSGVNRLLPGVLVMMVFIRFAMPVMLIANDLVYQQFLADRYQQSTGVVEHAGKALERLQKDAEPEQANVAAEGMLDSITRAWSTTVDSIDLAGRLEDMQRRAAEVIEHLIQLSVVFILQTALLPIAFLWLFLAVFKRVLTALPGARPGSAAGSSES